MTDCLFLFQIPSQNLKKQRKMINIKLLTLTEMQPTFQIPTSFSSFSFEWIPVGRLLTGAGGKGEEKKERIKRET